MTTIRHKQGRTLDWAAVYRDSDGVPVDLTGYTLACTIREVVSGSSAATASIVVANQGTNPGEFSVGVLQPGQVLAIRNPAAMDAAGTWVSTLTVEYHEALALSSTTADT